MHDVYFLEKLTRSIDDLDEYWWSCTQWNALKNENVPPANTACIRLNSNLHFDLSQHFLV